MLSIDKRFDFCYGHRVWAQKLKQGYTEAGHTKTKCRHLHGHTGSVTVFLQSEQTNQAGMVEDFSNIGWIKNFIDDNIDHRFLLDLSDPWLVNLANVCPEFQNNELVEWRPKLPPNTTDQKKFQVNKVYVPDTYHLAGWTIDTSGCSGPEKEFYDSFFFINFIPTSEMLAEWMFNCIEAKTKQTDGRLYRLDWHESPKSKATFTR